MRSLLAVMAGAVVVCGCAMPQTSMQPKRNPIGGHLGLLLKPGMTEQDVINVLGQPKQSNLETCGGATGHPWGCKIWIYGYPLGKGLRVYFHEGQPNTWLVDNWTNS